MLGYIGFLFWWLEKKLCSQSHIGYIEPYYILNTSMKGYVICDAKHALAGGNCRPALLSFQCYTQSMCEIDVRVSECVKLAKLSQFDHLH